VNETDRPGTLQQRGLPDTDSAAETDRLAALQRYGIMDTAPEPAFDNIVALAARMFAVRQAAIAFIDSERVWFKARVGVELPEIPRHLILYGEPMHGNKVQINHDIQADPLFADHPMAKARNFRFYGAGMVDSRDGHLIGGIFILDDKPRPDISDDAGTAGLEALARLVEAELELRQARQAVSQAG
jgi:GAF domain-containing protein